MYICSCISPCMILRTNPISRILISVLVLTYALGRNLISVFGLTNPLGCKLISALVLTSHLKCHMVFLILLCLAAPFFNSPWLFLFSISLISIINQPLLKIFIIQVGMQIKTGSIHRSHTVNKL